MTCDSHSRPLARCVQILFLLLLATSAAAQTQIGGGSGGGTTPNSIPSIFQVPTSGLLADYQMRSTDAVCTLPDYSGSSNNATACVGTSPTIIATTGGLQFNANGAISLPAALNSSLSIVIFCSFQGLGLAQQGYAFVDGSTAGTANVTRFGLDDWIGSTTLQPSPLGNNYRMRVVSNAIQTTPTGPMDVINGTQTITLTMDTANHLYINGAEVKDYGPSTPLSSAGLMTTGNYQLGGNGTNSSYFQGQIYRVLFYSRVITPTEVQLIAAANTEYGNAHGVTTINAATGLSSTNNRIIFVGDSITRGFGVVNPWTGLVSLGANFNTPISQSVSGAVASQITASEATSLFPFFNSNTTKDAAVLWAGTNDFVGGATAPQIQAFNAAFCRNAHTVIFRCGLITMLSRTGNDANKNLLNPLIRNELGQSADFIIDLGGTTQLGADGASATAAFQGDHIHPIEGSTWNVVSTLVTQGVNRAYGNQNFSSANTYVAPATAPVATTGGTEGGNVITITFAGSNQCLYARQCTCTGITPAGYNGLWFPATSSSATQMVVFSDTTGLGAITIQGTCGVPQMQDADKYVILNFGAGNYTLETCQGYTGQNIYIRNINGVASTLVPFPGVVGGFPGTTWAAETIVGTAAPTVLAAGATAILQSQLVSQAAGGCTWARIQ